MWFLLIYTYVQSKLLCRFPPISSTDKSCQIQLNSLRYENDSNVSVDFVRECFISQGGGEFGQSTNCLTDDDPASFNRTTAYCISWYIGYMHLSNHIPSAASRSPVCRVTDLFRTPIKPRHLTLVSPFGRELPTMMKTFLSPCMTHDSYLRPY